MASSHQPAITCDPAPTSTRFITFELAPGADPARVVEGLAGWAVDPGAIVGLGQPLFSALGRSVPGLRPFPADLGLFPATQHALWLALTHADPGAAFDAGRTLGRRLGSGVRVVEEVDGFRYRDGRDLSGYEDGTENPKGEAALAAALVAGRGPGLDGGSFLAVQRWVHDLAVLDTMNPQARDHVVGRRLEDNEELEDAPISAHVKRTAQESFEPEAFVLRRSLPYGGLREHGLYFVAYGECLDRFERQLRRMAGAEDGVLDGLLTFTRPVTGGYYFCPPVRGERLALDLLGTA